MSAADRPQSRRTGLTRRRFIIGASLLAAGGVAVGGRYRSRRLRRRRGKTVPRCALAGAPSAAGPPARLGRDAARRQRRQPDRTALRSAAVLRRHRATPTPSLRARARGGAAHARARLSDGGRTGLLFTAGWGPCVLRASPRGPPRRSRSPRRCPTSSCPSIDDYDLCLHLACDDEQRLAAVEAALVHGAPLSGATGHSTSRASCLARDANRLRRHRAAGRPSERRRHPAWEPRAPKGAPLFMGFKSGLRNATRPPRTTSRSPRARSPAARPCTSATCACASTAGTRTSRSGERVARMYAPQVTPEQVSRFTTDAPAIRSSWARRSTATA